MPRTRVARTSSRATCPAATSRSRRRRYVRFVDCVDVEPVTTLFVMDGDGGRMRGISANHVHDWHPAVLNDGRMIYTRWEYTDRSQMWPHKLFVKNPDGYGHGRPVRQQLVVAGVDAACPGDPRLQRESSARWRGITRARTRRARSA